MARVPRANAVVVVHYNTFEVDESYVADCLLFEAFRARPARVDAIGEGLGEVVLKRAARDPRLGMYAENLRVVLTSSSWERSCEGH